MYECLSARMYVRPVCAWCPGRSEEGVGSSETNLGSLQVQQVLLAAEPSLQPQGALCTSCYVESGGTQGNSVMFGKVRLYHWLMKFLEIPDSCVDMYAVCFLCNLPIMMIEFPPR